MPLTRVPLDRVLTEWRPGSQGDDWTWDQEEQDLLTAPCWCTVHPADFNPLTSTPCGTPGHYQLMLEAHLRARGQVEQGIYLGPDRRVWDGHHRIVAARRLGFPDLPIEPGSARPAGPLADLMARLTRGLGHAIADGCGPMVGGGWRDPHGGGGR